MGSFAYVAPKTVQETTEALRELSGAGTPTQIMAGGTDVLVQLRTVNRAARTLVDIKGLCRKPIGWTSALTRPTSARQFRVRC